MGQYTLNNTLCLTFPDSFHIMSEEEAAGLRANANKGDGVVLKAEEHHMAVSLAWKAAGGFFARLLTGNDPVANLETCYKKQFKPFNYGLDGHLSITLGGETAQGIRYHYTAQEIDMTGESYVLSKEGTEYYLHVYYRTMYAEECRNIWNAAIKTAVWE